MFGKVLDLPRKIFLLILEIESSQLRLSLKLTDRQYVSNVLTRIKLWG